MIACIMCHRLRTPAGLHICVPARLVRQSPPIVVEKVATPGAELRRLNTFKLAGNGPAAAVWNALVEGRR